MFGLLKKSARVTTERLSEIAGFLRFGGTVSGAPVNERTALDVAAVLCAVRVISEGVAQVPIRVIRDDYQGDKLVRTVDRSHWCQRLLAEAPNEWQTPFEFREYATFCAVLGEGFLGVKVVNGEGQVREILPLPIGSWSVDRGNGWALEFTATINGQTVRFGRDAVFYMRGPSYDGYKGLSAVQKAREAIGLAQVLEKQQARLAGNGGKPSGVLSFAQPLKPEAKEKLRDSWQDKFGPNGEGGVAILDGDAKFASMTMTSVDAQHIETRKHQIEEIARAFRVHPIMLMHSNTTTTFASAEQHFRNHAIHTLGPWMARFEQACKRDLLAKEAGLRVDLDERGLLRGDFKDQADYYAKALGAGGGPGWMTQNEVRAERDMNPVLDDSAYDRVPAGAMEPKRVTE